MEKIPEFFKDKPESRALYEALKTADEHNKTATTPENKLTNPEEDKWEKEQS